MPPMCLVSSKQLMIKVSSILDLYTITFHFQKWTCTSTLRPHICKLQGDEKLRNDNKRKEKKTCYCMNELSRAHPKCE